MHLSCMAEFELFSCGIHFAGRNACSCSKWYSECAKIVQEEPFPEKGGSYIFVICGKDQGWCSAKYLTGWNNMELCGTLWKDAGDPWNNLLPTLSFASPCDIKRWSENGVTPFFHPKLWYGLAKVFAEKAAWEFAKENNIDLVTVLPSFVIGPSLSHELCVTAKDVLGLLQGILVPCSMTINFCFSYINHDRYSAFHVNPNKMTFRWHCQVQLLWKDGIRSHWRRCKQPYPRVRDARGHWEIPMQLSGAGQQWAGLLPCKTIPDLPHTSEVSHLLAV